MTAVLVRNPETRVWCLYWCKRSDESCCIVHNPKPIPIPVPRLAGGFLSRESTSWKPREGFELFGWRDCRDGKGEDGGSDAGGSRREGRRNELAHLDVMKKSHQDEKAGSVGRKAEETKEGSGPEPGKGTRVNNSMRREKEALKRLTSRGQMVTARRRLRS